MPHHLDIIVLLLVLEAAIVVWAPVAQAQANGRQRHIRKATMQCTFAAGDDATWSLLLTELQQHLSSGLLLF